MIGRLDRAIAKILRPYRQEIDPRGRVRVYLGRSHPWAYKSGFCWRSRIVMRLAIGRKLKRSEHVHHTKLDRSDDRLGRLRLMTRRQHARLHAELRRGKRC